MGAPTIKLVWCCGVGHGRGGSNRLAVGPNDTVLVKQYGPMLVSELKVIDFSHGKLRFVLYGFKAGEVRPYCEVSWQVIRDIVIAPEQDGHEVGRRRILSENTVQRCVFSGQLIRSGEDAGAIVGAKANETRTRGIAA